MKDKILNIINNNESDKASDMIIELFSNYDLYHLSYLDENKKECKIDIWSISKDDAFDELAKICPNVTYIFINLK